MACSTARVLIASVIDLEPELGGPRDRERERHGRLIGTQVGPGEKLLAVGEDAAIDPPLAFDGVVEADLRSLVD